MTATGVFLEINGHGLTASNELVLLFAVKTVAEQTELEEIGAWLRV